MKIFRCPDAQQKRKKSLTEGGMHINGKTTPDRSLNGADSGAPPRLPFLRLKWAANPAPRERNNFFPVPLLSQFGVEVLDA